MKYLFLIFITICQGFAGSALGADWPESESMHHFEFGTKLGVDLEIYF